MFAVSVFFSLSLALNCHPKTLSSEMTPTPDRDSLQPHRCWPLGTCLALGPDLQSCWPPLISLILGLAPETSPSCVPHPICCGTRCGDRERRPPLRIYCPLELLDWVESWAPRGLCSQRLLLPVPGTLPSSGSRKNQSILLSRGLGHGPPPICPSSSPCKCCLGRSHHCKRDVNNHVQSHCSCCHSAACTEETESFSYSNKSVWVFDRNLWWLFKFIISCKQ